MHSKFLQSLGESRLYPLTDRVISGLSHKDQVSLHGMRGLTLIQLREKLLSPNDFYREALAALKVARALGIKLIINDRVDIALALKADGVHLGQDDLPPDVARHLLGPDAIIGFSTHNLEQAKQAAQMSVDYVAIGPIFPTDTKRSSNLPVGLAGLSLIRKAIGDMPLVAIGGIDSASHAEVLRSGADAVAVISDLWSAPKTSP